MAVTSSLTAWAGTQAALSTTASTGVSGTTSNNNILTYNAPTATWGLVVAYAAYESLTGGNPLATRALAKQVGSYFWYASHKAKTLGYAPRPLRDTLTQTIAWLLQSPHMTQRRRKRVRPPADVVATAY